MQPLLNWEFSCPSPAQIQLKKVHLAPFNFSHTPCHRTARGHGKCPPAWEWRPCRFPQKGPCTRLRSTGTHQPCTARSKSIPLLRHDAPPHVSGTTRDSSRGEAGLGGCRGWRPMRAGEWKYLALRVRHIDRPACSLCGWRSLSCTASSSLAEMLKSIKVGNV